MDNDSIVVADPAEDSSVDDECHDPDANTATGCDNVTVGTCFDNSTTVADNLVVDITHFTLHIRIDYPGGRQVKTAMKLLSCFVILVALISGLFFASQHYEVRKIATGSMRPQLPIGSLLLIQKTHTDFHKGDIISFHETDGQIVSHRFIGVDKKTGGIMTKGDANLTPDVHFVPLTDKDVVGRVVLHYDLFAPAVWRTWRGPVMIVLLLMLGLGIFGKSEEPPKAESEGDKENDEQDQLAGSNPV